MKQIQKHIQYTIYLHHMNIIPYLCSLVFIISTSLCFSQPNNYDYSLEECIEYGLENNTNIQNTRFDEYIAQKDIDEVWATGLPQINGLATIQNNFQLPVFILPTETGEFQEVTFGLPWQALTQASGRQLLFDSKFFIGLKASKAFYNLAQKTTNRTQEETAYAISQAFYSALTIKEQLSLLTANLERVTKLFNETKALNENGFNEKIDVERVQINKTNLELELANAALQAERSIDLLKFQMGMPIQNELTINQDIEHVEIRPISSADMEQIEISNRIEHAILTNSIELQQFDVQRHQLSYLPELYLTGSYSWNRQWDPDLENPIKFTAGVTGIELSIPLFDGLQRVKRAQRAKLELRKAENDLRQFELAFNRELKDASTTWQNAYNNLATMRENRKLAEDVYRVSTIKYKEGVGSSLEVNDAETQLKQTEINYLRGLFDYLLARLAYQKAKGDFSRYHR